MKQSLLSQKWNPSKIARGVGLILIILLIVFADKRSSRPDREVTLQLVIYAYSTLEEVLTQAIFPAFQADWESKMDSEMEIQGVFGSSGILAGQISIGAPADIAIISSGNHFNYLLISRTVKQDTDPIYFGTTPIVIVTRPGNPAGIRDFSDLGELDVFLIHADPRVSGVGEWSLIAEYGSFFINKGDEASALDQVHKIWRNVNQVAPSARTAMTLFEMGAGEVLITYEQDALLAAQRGVDLEIVIPSSTVLAEPAAVAIDQNITRFEREAVEAFLVFLNSHEARQIFSNYHFRSDVDDTSDKHTNAHFFKLSDIDGLRATYNQLLKPYWENQILPELELHDQPTLISTEE